MQGLNRVELIGNLGQDPQLRYTQNGSAVVTLSVAIAEIRRLRAHRKCPCGGLGGIKKMHGKYWAECNNCECSTDTLDTPEEAWAAWDGVA